MFKTWLWKNKIGILLIKIIWIRKKKQKENEIDKLKYNEKEGLTTNDIGPFLSSQIPATRHIVNGNGLNSMYLNLVTAEEIEKNNEKLWSALKNYYYSIT